MALLLVACGREETPGAGARAELAPAGQTAPANVVAKTKRDVDVAVAAGKQAIDAAVDAAR